MPRLPTLALCGFALSASLKAEPAVPAFVPPPALPDVNLRFSETPATGWNPPATRLLPKPQPLAFVSPTLPSVEPSSDPFAIVPKESQIGAMPMVSERPGIDFKMLVIAPTQTTLNLRQSR